MMRHMTARAQGELGFKSRCARPFGRTIHCGSADAQGADTLLARTPLLSGAECWTMRRVIPRTRARRTHPPMGLLGLPLALALQLGCALSDQEAARSHLEGEGFVEVSLSSPTSGEPIAYVARLDDYRCFGTVRVARGPSSRKSEAEHHCRLDEAICGAGKAAVCVELARLHERGDADPQDPITPDPVHASDLYALGCHHGNADACNTMAIRVAYGTGTERSPEQALVLFGQACSGGSAAGCYNMGRRYADGTGVPNDPERARTLYDEACARGLEQACQARWE